MHSNTQKQTNGYMGLAVLALFAVAIIAGQARSDVNLAYMFDPDLPTALELSVLVERDPPVGAKSGYAAIRHFRTMPNVVDFGVNIRDLSELAFSTGLASRSARQETIL